MPESPRWLLAVGRTEEAEAILLKAAEKNRVPREYVTAAIQHSQQNQEGKKNVKHNITHLFRTPNMRMKSICVIFNWFAAGCVFFGLAQYIGFLHGNIFVNVAASGNCKITSKSIQFLLFENHLFKINCFVFSCHGIAGDANSPGFDITSFSFENFNRRKYRVQYEFVAADCRN